MAFALEHVPLDPVHNHLNQGGLLVDGLRAAAAKHAPGCVVDPIPKALGAHLLSDGLARPRLPGRAPDAGSAKRANQPEVLLVLFLLFGQIASFQSPLNASPAELLAPEMQEQVHELVLVHVPDELLDVLALGLLRHVVELRPARVPKREGRRLGNGNRGRLARAHVTRRSGPAASRPRRLGASGTGASRPSSILLMLSCKSSSWSYRSRLVLVLTTCTSSGRDWCSELRRRSQSRWRRSKDSATSSIICQSWVEAAEADGDKAFAAILMKAKRGERKAEAFFQQSDMLRAKSLSPKWQSPLWLKRIAEALHCASWYKLPKSEF